MFACMLDFELWSKCCSALKCVVCVCGCVGAWIRQWTDQKYQWWAAQSSCSAWEDTFSRQGFAIILVVFSAPLVCDTDSCWIKLCLLSTLKVHVVAILPLYCQSFSFLLLYAALLVMSLCWQAPCWRQWTVLADAPLGKGQSVVVLPINAADGPNLAFVNWGALSPHWAHPSADYSGLSCKEGGGGLSSQATGHMDGWRPTACVLVLGLPLLVATGLLKTMQISMEAKHIKGFSVQFHGGAENNFKH